MVSEALTVRAESPDLLHLFNEASIFNLAGVKLVALPQLY